jgi:hypothetical protein
VVAVLNRLALALLLITSTAAADDAKSTSTSERGTTSAPISAAKEDEEGTPKLSLPTQADRDAWQNPGFRLGLGMDYGRMIGLRGAPSGRLLGAVLHAGLRLDRDWSLLATFHYGSASQSGGLSALRFAGTVDPTWHVTPSVALAIGFGFGGLVEGNTGRMDNPQQATDVSITLPSSNPPVSSCTGVGAAGLFRASYNIVLGPRATFEIDAEVIGQYTSCQGRRPTVEPDTAQPIVRTQYWSHTGATLGLGFAWR